MAGRLHRFSRLGLIALTLSLPSTAMAQVDVPDPCNLTPGQVGCDVGGDGGGEPTTDPPYSFTPWRFVGACDFTDFLQFVRERVYRDGRPNETERVCVDPGEAEDEVWDDLEDAVEALSDARWEASPDNAVGPGLTGLETWLWYSGETRVGPLFVTWTDAGTGVVFEAEGRAWTGEMSWDAGDGTTVASEVGAFDEALGAGGSLEEPAGTHVYETSARHAGFEGGYPVEMSLLWVGEWRYRVAGDAWSGWLPMANTSLDTFAGTYDVWQVRGVLTG